LKNSSDSCFTEDDQGITYREGISPFTSVLLGVFGLAFLAIAVVFFSVIAGWPWHSGKIAGLLTVLIFACFAIAVVLLAISGVQPQHLMFDKQTRRVSGRMRGRLWLLKTIDASFDTLQLPEIKSTSREMDTDLHEIRIQWAGEPPLALGSFDDWSHAEYWQKKLSIFLKK
jgi:hypothetical protein